jgi:hypothetical protein
MVLLGSRDGSSQSPLLSDDQDFASVASRPTARHITLENGDNPGIWNYLVAGPFGPNDEVLDPMNVSFATPRAISGHRIAFIADKNVDGSRHVHGGDVHVPGSATQLTTDSTSLGLTWTAQSVAAPGTGAPSERGPDDPTTPTNPTTPTSRSPAATTPGAPSPSSSWRRRASRAARRRRSPTPTRRPRR